MTKPENIIEQLRESIDKMGVTRYRIAKATGIPQSVLSRFVNTKAAMTMENFAIVCDFLGLRLEPTGKPKFSPAPKRKRKGK
jgi:plasmid maintenance system antidote protein VapI